MPPIPKHARPKLSICISTWNRGHNLGETLRSIVDQITDECEIVVFDTASEDQTESVVAAYVSICPQLRYVRAAVVGGFDKDRDRAIELSAGDYFWTVSSKDLLKAGAIETVLRLLRDDVCVVIVNMEIRNRDLSSVLVDKSVEFASDRIYRPHELSRLFSESYPLSSHYSCTIMRRDIWAERERVKYYGSIGAHIGVLFQLPLPSNAVVVSKPLICHRYGGMSWVKAATEMLVKWPALVDSLSISHQTKQEFRQLMSPERLGSLLEFRAFGWYSWSNYRKTVAPSLPSRRKRMAALIVAILPGHALNAIFLLRTLHSTEHYKGVQLDQLRQSRFHFRNLSLCRLFKRASITK